MAMLNNQMVYIYIYTLWLFNIAMENPVYIYIYIFYYVCMLYTAKKKHMMFISLPLLKTATTSL